MSTLSSQAHRGGHGARPRCRRGVWLGAHGNEHHCYAGQNRTRPHPSQVEQRWLDTRIAQFLENLPQDSVLDAVAQNCDDGAGALRLEVDSIVACAAEPITELDNTNAVALPDGTEATDQQPVLATSGDSVCVPGGARPAVHLLKAPSSDAWPFLLVAKGLRRSLDTGAGFSELLTEVIHSFRVIPGSLGRSLRSVECKLAARPDHTSAHMVFPMP